MTPVRWPLLLDEHEAQFDEADPWNADALAVEATEYVAQSDLAPAQGIGGSIMIMTMGYFLAAAIVCLAWAIL